MFLDSNKKLAVVLATAKTTLNMPVTVDYVDLTSTTTTAASTQAYTNGITAVDILVAPAASTIRKVNGLLLYERDTLAKTVKIYSVDATPTTGLITAGAFVAGNDYQIVSVGTTDFTLIGASANTIGVIFTATGVGTGTGTAATSYPVVDVTLQVDDTLGYTDSNGWYTLDMSGNLKTVVGTSASAIADAIHNSASKATPVDADEVGLWDSVTGLLNHVTWANIKATLGTTFSALSGSASQAFACSTLTPATGITGNSDGSSAGAGLIGEIISSTVASGSAVSLTTATAANVSSITLTPGRWLVFTETFFLGDGSTSITIHGAGMNTTSATFPAANRYRSVSVAFVPAAGTGFGGLVGPYAPSVSVNTPVYHVAQATFTAGVLQAFGTIKAVRI